MGLNRTFYGGGAGGSGSWAEVIVPEAEMDGVTDDSEALQAAVDEAIASGKPIWLRPGTAVVETPIEIPVPIVMSGSGRQATALKAGDGLNDYILKFTSTGGEGLVGAYLSDFMLDGNCGGNTAGGGIDAHGAVQCSFERLWIRNAYNWGMQLREITGGGFGHHNRITECLFDATLTSDGHGGGLYITSSDENWLYGSDFEFLGGETAPSGASTPVALYDRAGLQKFELVNFVGGRNNCKHIQVKDVKLTTILGCTFDGSAGDSVFLTGSRHVVMGNTFTSPGDQGDTPASGLHLEFGAQYITVIGNIFETSPTVGKTRSLIRERADGDAGLNVYSGNRLYQNAAATAALEEYEGVGSVHHKPPQVDVFAASGTWSKPAGATSVEVLLIGGGGGGGSGRRGAAGSVRCGGGGGAGGSLTKMTLPASALTATVAVTVGAGSAGGAARTTDDTDGATASTGGATSFGSYVRVSGGNGGGGGTATAGSGGTGNPGSTTASAGAAASATGGTGGSATSSPAAGPGGGGGGGITAADSPSAGGGGGGNHVSTTTGGSAGVVGGAAAGAGIAGAASGLNGSGGGGGAASITGAAGAGGAGGAPGGGGGGGGASLNGNSSGAGGAGGNGIAVIWTYF